MATMKSIELHGADDDIVPPSRLLRRQSDAIVKSDSFDKRTISAPKERTRRLTDGGAARSDHSPRRSNTQEFHTSLYAQVPSKLHNPTTASVSGMTLKHEDVILLKKMEIANSPPPQKLVVKRVPETSALLSPTSASIANQTVKHKELKLMKDLEEEVSASVKPTTKKVSPTSTLLTPTAAAINATWKKSDLATEKHGNFNCLSPRISESRRLSARSGPTVDSKLFETTFAMEMSKRKRKEDVDAEARLLMETKGKSPKAKSSIPSSSHVLSPTKALEAAKRSKHFESAPEKDPREAGWKLAGHKSVMSFLSQAIPLSISLSSKMSSETGHEQSPSSPVPPADRSSANAETKPLKVSVPSSRLLAPTKGNTNAKYRAPIEVLKPVIPSTSKHAAPLSPHLLAPTISQRISSASFTKTEVAVDPREKGWDGKFHIDNKISSTSHGSRFPNRHAPSGMTSSSDQGHSPTHSVGSSGSGGGGIRSFTNDSLKSRNEDTASESSDLSQRAFRARSDDFLSDGKRTHLSIGALALSRGRAKSLMSDSDAGGSESVISSHEVKQSTNSLPALSHQSEADDRDTSHLSKGNPGTSAPHVQSIEPEKGMPGTVVAVRESSSVLSHEQPTVHPLSVPYEDTDPLTLLDVIYKPHKETKNGKNHNVKKDSNKTPSESESSDATSSSSSSSFPHQANTRNLNASDASRDIRESQQPEHDQTEPSVEELADDNISAVPRSNSFRWVKTGHGVGVKAIAAAADSDHQLGYGTLDSLSKDMPPLISPHLLKPTVANANAKWQKPINSHHSLSDRPSAARATTPVPNAQDSAAFHRHRSGSSPVTVDGKVDVSAGADCVGANTSGGIVFFHATAKKNPLMTPRRRSGAVSGLEEDLIIVNNDNVRDIGEVGVRSQSTSIGSINDS